MSMKATGGGWGDGSVNSVEKIYNFDPLARLRSVGKTEFGLGVQGNMWTETTNNNAELGIPTLASFVGDLRNRLVA